MHVNLTEFLKHYTEALELCAIQLSGYVIFTCWIDYEDIWTIPAKYAKREVVCDNWGELTIVKVESDGVKRKMGIPCHFISIGENDI